MGVRKTLVAALIGTGAALTSAPAFATHIAGFGFSGQPFTFDGSAYCSGALAATCTEFTATSIDFSYQAEVDQTGFTFAETGFAAFSSFQITLGNPVDGLVSGLNTGGALGYRMYATFSGTGTTALNGVFPNIGIDGTFNAFAVTIWIDDDANTTCSTASGTTACSNTGDDDAILTGILNEGGFHVLSGLLGGDFDVLVDVTSFDSSIWGGAAFSGQQVQADMNGVNSVVTGVALPPQNFTNAHIEGSGNVSFQSVPEPGSLSLLALGLLGFGAMMRRQPRSRAA